MTEELNKQDNLNEVTPSAELVWETPTLARMDVVNAQATITNTHVVTDGVGTS
jgi:hypothetical protein